MAAPLTFPEKVSSVPLCQQADIPARKFQDLTTRWRRETALRSSVTSIAMHPAYQQIIGLGEPALPLIFQELRREPDHWFWALGAITGENPVPDDHAGDLEAMADDWLSWAHTYGYL